MIATPQPPSMTLAEYLVWEPLQELRYEYIHGSVVAMTGGTIPHNDIALNFYRALYPQVRSKNLFEKFWDSLSSLNFRF
jgi:Uma2 family endonuclease